MNTTTTRQARSRLCSPAAARAARTKPACCRICSRTSRRAWVGRCVSRSSPAPASARSTLATWRLRKPNRAPVSGSSTFGARSPSTTSSPSAPIDLVRVPWQLLGLGGIRAALPSSGAVPERLPGLFDTAWLESIVLDSIPWDSLRRNLTDGVVHALAIAATEIATGRSIVFVDKHGETISDWAGDRFVIPRTVEIGPAHALASAAIPLIFPAIRIDRTYYCDGGLRLNTPLSPALRLGAERVLVIGLRYPRPAEEEDRIARRREANVMQPTYLFGKALNALLLDRVEYDVDRMRLFNAILEAGVRTYGPDFLVRINEPIIALRKKPYRIVRDCMLRPSKDLGVLAAECLRHQTRSRGLRDWLSRNVVRFAGHGALAEADLLSYLFFDRCYADHLIELGRHDAAQAADELTAFFS